MSKDNQEWPETDSIESLTDSQTEAAFEEDLKKADAQLAEMSQNTDPIERAKLTLAKATALLGLNRKDQLWQDIRPLLDLFIEHHHLDEAVQTCDILYQSGNSESTTALVHGIWLSVSFPVDPHLTVSMLNHFVDETPKDSDGAALAATTAHYIVGIRAKDDDFENLNFFTANLLSQVASGHRPINNQEELDVWLEKLELKNPDVFLPRLGAVLNVLVNERDWWFDRDDLRARFPQ